MERRFQPVKVGEPNPADTLRILEGLRDRYEAFHKAKITDEALKAAVELSGRYITDRFQPDKSIDVIDEAAAKVRMEASSAPEGLKNKEAQLASLQKERKRQSPRRTMNALLFTVTSPRSLKRISNS